MRNGKSRAEVVVVTGATSGIGRAIARAFAADGAAVALLGRSQEGLDAVRAEVEAEGARAITVATDVADSDRVDAAATIVEETLGPIDVWVNNAMVTIFAPFDEIAPEEYRRATDVTYLGTVWGPARRSRGWCRAITARWCRWGPRWPTAASRCRRRIAARSTRSRASRSRWGRS